MQNSVILPQWLDNLIFEQLGAKYCRYNADMTVIDWDKNDVLNYLGTYFPRSYAESYCIFNELFHQYPSTFAGKTDICIFDFGCGTGGEIIGFLTAISENIRSVHKVKISALDGNFHSLRFLEKIVDIYKGICRMEVELRLIPHKIEDFYDLSILDSIIPHGLDMFVSFKAICEFVTKERFEQQNAYTHIIKTFLPKLDENGLMVLADLTSLNEVSQEWLPRMMDAGCSQTDCQLLMKNNGYNQSFTVTHKRKTNDISKIAWRILKR